MEGLLVLLLVCMFIVNLATFALANNYLKQAQVAREDIEQFRRHLILLAQNKRRNR